MDERQYAELRRAKERDAAAVDEFKRKTWPALKKKPAGKVA